MMKSQMVVKLLGKFSDLREVLFSLSVIPVFLMALLMTLTSSASAAINMVEMNDADMSEVTGQALMTMSKRDGIGVSSGLDFYRAGLDAVLELNANIQKLQLGCGGINGPGCDIDIDNLSLSGQCDSNRPGCSAALTRPFLEFAIKNDDTKTMREVVGFRLSAENALGMLTFGQNTDQPRSEEHTSELQSRPHL